MAGVGGALSISSQGSSDSWEGQKRRVVAVWELFSKRDDVKDQLAKSWEELPEELLCDGVIYEKFAAFLAHDYKIPMGNRNGGQHYASGTTIGFLQIIIRMAHAKFFSGGKPATKLFFTCLDHKSRTSAARWLHGLKKEILRVYFQRAKHDGCLKMDNKCEPIYRSGVMGMVAAYSCVGGGTREGARRKFAILCTWQAAGRAGEMGYLPLSALSWDPFYNCIIADLPQSKKSVVKRVMFVSGAEEFSDFFVAFGDILIMDPYTVVEDEVTWAVQALRATKKPGTKLGTFIKALADGNGEFEKYVVDILPDNPAAGGLRHGAVELLCSSMPAEFVVVTTGHDLKNESALYEYLGAPRATLTPGATVLGGFPPLAWGQLGLGPQAPSIDPIFVAFPDIDRIKVVEMIVGLYDFNPATPPILQVGGRLFPAVEAAFASLLMHYGDRFAKGRLLRVCQRLQGAYLKFIRPELQGPMSWNIANNELSKLGDCVRTDWKLRNLHLTMRNSAKGHEKIVQAVQDLRNMYETSHKNGMALVLGKLHELQSGMAQIKTGHSSSSTGMPQRGIDSPGTAAPSPSSKSPHPSKSTGKKKQQKQNAFKLMQATHLGQSRDKLKGVYAADFFLDCLVNNNGNPVGNLSAGDKCRGNEVIKFFSAMSTDEERQFFKEKSDPKEHPKKIGMLKNLDQLVSGRIVRAFESSSVGVPKGLRTKNKSGHRKPLKCNAIDTHVRALKKGGVTIVVDAANFAKFRAEYESSGAGASSSGGAGADSGPAAKKRRR